MDNIIILHEDEYNKDEYIEHIYDGDNKTPYVKVKSKKSGYVPFVRKSNKSINIELEYKILSNILNYKVCNSNIYIENNIYFISYYLEYGTPVYIDPDNYDKYLEDLNMEIKYEYSFDNILLYYIIHKYRIEVKKHKKYDIWYSDDKTINSYITELENNNIYGIYIKNNKAIELIKAFDYKILYKTNTTAFIEMLEPFGYNWFMENLIRINMGELPYLIYNLKNKEIYKEIYAFLYIYLFISDYNIEIKHDKIIYSIDNMIKYKYIINNILDTKDVFIYSFKTSLEKNKYIKDNNIVPIIIDNNILWTNKVNSYSISKSKYFIPDCVLEYTKNKLIIYTSDNKYFINHNNDKDIIKKWNDGVYLSDWDKSYIQTFKSLPLFVFR